MLHIRILQHVPTHPSGHLNSNCDLHQNVREYFRMYVNIITPQQLLDNKQDHSLWDLQMSFWISETH